MILCRDYNLIHIILGNYLMAIVRNMSLVLCLDSFCAISSFSIPCNNNKQYAIADKSYIIQVSRIECSVSVCLLYGSRCAHWCLYKWSFFCSYIAFTSYKIYINSSKLLLSAFRTKNDSNCHLLTRSMFDYYVFPLTFFFVVLHSCTMCSSNSNIDKH